MSDDTPKKPRLVPPLKPVGRATGFVKLRAMKCFAEAHQMVLDGWPMTDLARFVQEIKKEYTDVTRESLVTTLKEYRKSLPPGELIKERLPQVFLDAAEEVSEKIDELDELEKLYKIQMRRIQIDFEKEKAIGKLFGSTGQEVRIAREILSSFADLKMDLGLTKRHIGQMEVDAKVVADIAGRYEDPALPAVMEDAQSRRKVLNIAERVLGLLGRGTVSPLDDLVNPGDAIDVTPVEASVKDKPDDN